MDTMASQTTSRTIVYPTVYSGADQRKHQSSASLAFVWGIHRWPANSPHKRPVKRKVFPFDDVIMLRGRKQYVKEKNSSISGIYDLFFFFLFFKRNIFQTPCFNPFTSHGVFNECRPNILSKPIKSNLTHWGRDKMDAIFQTTFSNAFLWMKMYEFRLRFHWSLFLRFQLTLIQHWFR